MSRDYMTVGRPRGGPALGQKIEFLAYNDEWLPATVVQYLSTQVVVELPDGGHRVVGASGGNWRKVKT
jgi:hypothetical protein